MSFLNEDCLVWFDGEFVPITTANVSVMSHTLHYGSGVFEGVRAYATENGSAIFRLQDHTKRFFNSAKMIRMKLPIDEKTFNQAQIDLIKRNNFSSAYIRPFAFYSGEALGIYPKPEHKVHVVIATWSWSNYFDLKEKGIKVTTSTFRRNNINSTLTKAKISGNYVNSMIALQEAKSRGFHEAILLDINGYVAEGSSANLFLVIKGELHTPLTNNILPGITRDTIIYLAKDFGFKVVERNITRDELYLADEIFFTGTAVEVTPVSYIDNFIVGSGDVGSITSKLKEKYQDVVQNKVNKYSQWNAF